MRPRAAALLSFTGLVAALPTAEVKRNDCPNGWTEVHKPDGSIECFPLTERTPENDCPNGWTEAHKPDGSVECFPLAKKDGECPAGWVVVHKDDGTVDCIPLP